MQNVQNAAEIQQRVINLVDLYRRKVGYESQIAMDAKADYDYWNMESIRELKETGKSGGGYGEGPHTEVWIKHLMVNEQLLGHFYAVVAGENAEKDVLDQLLPGIYDKTIFTEEEETFLASHFKELVNYIILTPCDDSLEWVHRFDEKDVYTIPKEVLELIKSRVEITAGSKVYYPNTMFAQLANLFDGCKYYCDTMFYAWTRVAVYANDIDAVDNANPTAYDVIISYLPKGDDESKTIACLSEAYMNLPIGGKLVLICPPKVLVDKGNSSIGIALPSLLKRKDTYSVNDIHNEEKASTDANAKFRQLLVENKGIKEIIQLPQVMSKNAFDKYCLLIAEKGRSESDTVLIDTCTASNVIDTKHYILSFDNVKFNAILQNDGIDSNTGLRKLVKVPSEELSPKVLIPQLYVVERPSETEHPVPLSSLCSLVSVKVRDVKFDMPEDTPWITKSDLTPLFTGNLDMSDVRKADCPNNPSFVENCKDYAFGKDGKFVDSIWAQMNTNKGRHVLEYRNCTYLDSKHDYVLYECNPKDGIRMALVRTVDKPMVVGKGILVFSPKEGVDVNILFATLRLPVVYRQLLAYQEFGVDGHFDDILVPSNKRVICDELSRMKKENSITKGMKDNFEAGQNKHKTKLEDYQHAMRKHIREISSSVRRMERFINKMESSEEIKYFLQERLEVIKTHRLYLSEDIERLNEENTYGEAVPLDIDHCLKGFKDYFGTDAYPIAYSNEVAKEALKQYVESHRKELHDMNEADRSKNIDRIKKQKSFAYVDIAEYNFGKIVRNILENARIHGFSTDINRNDYKIEIILTWNSERKMYQIDFRNNGDPLPDGLSKESYGENRKYAGKTGRTGIGGYEVADTVKHYKGDYAISQDGDWVVVSVYLPKSKSYEEGV